MYFSDVSHIPEVGDTTRNIIISLQAVQVKGQRRKWHHGFLIHHEGSEIGCTFCAPLCSAQNNENHTKDISVQLNSKIMPDKR
jgi:radical SAM superfamily enzyme